MKTVFLMSDEVTAVLFILMICGGFFLLTSLVSWITGSKIKSRYGGVEYGSPDTIPAIFNFFSTNSKSIYKRIQSKISADKFSNLSTTTDKISLLKQLNELRENNTISREEFETLKEDILKK